MCWRDCSIVVRMARTRRFNVGEPRVGARCVLLLASFALLLMAGEAEDSHPCGNGVKLRLSSAKPSQGSVVLVEVRSASPLADLKAEWLGQPLHFWRESNRQNIHRALLGVDLERPAGAFPLALTTQLESGERLTCGALVSVQAVRFGVEKLHVGRQFVEPSPEDAERAKRETQRLRELFAGATPKRLWHGRFRLPVDGVQAAGNFGRRRFLNGQPRSPHSGVDFPAPAGTLVHATQRGRVALAEELFFSGNTVVIDHGLGLYTLYGHLESIAVGVGDTVEAGDPLGRVGATGRVTSAHLHWAVHVNEARVDPLELVKFAP
jgi:murein DD-endopeptidase MepM/ murein hydrolase activator NlpD